eukprot:365970-Chlamydomonas_euryale.AAC.11
MEQYGPYCATLVHRGHAYTISKAFAGVTAAAPQQHAQGVQSKLLAHAGAVRIPLSGPVPGLPVLAKRSVDVPEGSSGCMMGTITK